MARQLTVQHVGHKSFRVFRVDGGEPAAVSSVDEVIFGASMELYESLDRVKSAFPGREITVLERPEHNRIIRSTPETKQDVEQYLINYGSKPTPKEPGKPLTEASTDQISKVKSFLEGLKVAKTMVNKSAIKRLDIQIEIIETLIRTLI